MEKHTLAIFLLGLAIGSLVTSFFLLRAPEAAQNAYEAGVRRNSAPTNPAH